MMIDTSNQKGNTIMLMTVVVLSAILTVVLTTSDIVRNGLVSDKVQLDSTKAYFTAEAAAERILWHVRYQVNFSCTPGQYVFFDSNSDTPISTISCHADCSLTNNIETASDYKYCIKYELPSYVKLTNYGEYKGSKRAVDIMY